MESAAAAEREREERVHYPERQRDNQNERSLIAHPTPTRPNPTHLSPPFYIHLYIITYGGGGAVILPRQFHLVVPLGSAAPATFAGACPERTFAEKLPVQQGCRLHCLIAGRWREDVSLCLEKNVKI